MNRAESARRNGRKSKGPKTEAGKARSSQNACKHGILAERVFILETEDAAFFHTLLAEFEGIFRPQTQVEYELVCQIAYARWRLRRVWAYETEVQDIRKGDMDDYNDRYHPEWDDTTRQANAFRSICDSSQVLSSASRYEAALMRTYRAAIKDLQDLRALRLQHGTAELPNEPKPVSNDAARNLVKPKAALAPSRSAPSRPPVSPSASPEPPSSQRPFVLPTWLPSPKEPPESLP